MRKPRHNPQKEQNNKNAKCPYYDMIDSKERGQFNLCELGRDITKCKGEYHSCVKEYYHKLASQK